MYTKSITFTDYDGEKRTEEFQFNLNKAEILEMQVSETGGLAEYVKEIMKVKDHGKLVQLWKTIILKAYGEKSADGRRFVKSEEASKAFSETEAYAELFTEISLDPKAAAEFINGIVPKDLAVDLEKVDLDNPNEIAKMISSGKNGA